MTQGHRIHNSDLSGFPPHRSHTNSCLKSNKDQFCGSFSYSLGSVRTHAGHLREVIFASFFARADTGVADLLPGGALTGGPLGAPASALGAFGGVGIGSEEPEALLHAYFRSPAFRFTAALATGDGAGLETGFGDLCVFLFEGSFASATISTSNSGPQQCPHCGGSSINRHCSHVHCLHVEHFVSGHPSFPQERQLGASSESGLSSGSWP